MQICHGTKIVSILLVWAVILSGCSRHEPVLPPKTKRNTDSVEKIELTLTVYKPGYADKIEARSAYVIANERECSPMDHSQALGGRWNQPIEYIVLPVTQVEEGKFHVEAPKSPFLDEDYYSLGICRWSISSVHFTINRPGGSQAVVTTRDDIEHGKSRLAMCLLGSSPSGSICSDPDAVSQNIIHLYFPVTIESHKD